MPIDYKALGTALGVDTQEPVLGTSEIDPKSGLTFSEDEIARIQSRLAYGSPVEVYPGAVPKSTLRILEKQGYYPQFGEEYTQETLAREQGSFGQFANAMNQAVLGEIVGGTLEGIGYMLDLQQYGNLIRGEEEEFGNVLSDVGKALKTWTREVSPVHVSPTAKKYDPGNWAWWMNHFPSVASTLSLMIPSAGVVRGVGALGKLAGVAQGMGRTGKWMTTGISQAVVSRHMENLMEASGVYEEEMKRFLGLGMSKEEAKKAASVAASNTYKKQWAMLAQDIPQYLLLNKLGGMGPRGTSIKVNRALGIDPGRTIASKGATILRDMAGEAGEEAYQYLINEQSSLLAQRTIDPNIETSFSKVWQDNYDSGEMWTAATFGALGAGVMQAGFAGFNAKAIQASNKARVEEIQGRGEWFKAAYSEYQNAINSGDPFRKRQALANLKNSLAINAVNAGNEQDLIKSLDRLTNNPEDEIFERYGIDPEQGTILKDNPEIAADIKRTVKRVRELNNTFERENNLNNKIKGEQRKREFTSLMTWNQLMLESTKAEKQAIEQELSELSAASEKYNELTPQGKKVKELQNQIRAIHNPEHEIGSEDPYKKAGVMDVLTHRLKTQGDQMSDIEKARFEAEIGYQQRLFDIGSVELKQAQEEYTTEFQEKDKEVALTDDELVPLMSNQLRLQWVEAGIESLTNQMKDYRAGRKEKAPEVKDDIKGAKEDKYDPTADVHENDIVRYTDKDGNIQEGRVIELDVAEEDAEGTPVGKEGESGDNVFRIQPLDTKGEPTGEPITKLGSEVTVNKEARVTEEDVTETADILDDDVQKRVGVATAKDAKSNQGTPDPISNLSYSDFTGGEFVIRDTKLAATLSNPETSYVDSESELHVAFENPYLKTLRTRTTDRIAALVDSGRNKKELALHRKVLPYINKLIQKKYLTEEEVNSLISIGKQLPMGNVVDQLPISVNVTIEGTKYDEGGLYMHSSNFDYISIPPRIRRAMRKNPKARDEYIAKKKEEARAVRNAILPYILTGTSLYSKDLIVGRGSPNTLSKDLSKNKRKRNIATTLGIKPNKIVFAIGKAGAANPNYVTLWKGVGSKVAKALFGSESNIYVITNKTINGKSYSLKANVSKISEEHADIIFKAFHSIGVIEQSNKAKAWKRHKNTDKIKPNAKYSFKWDKDYQKVSGILPAELIDLLVAHGKKLTDPRSTSFKSRIRSAKHKAALLQKTLYLETTKDKATLFYGYNSQTRSPYEVDLLDSVSINAHLDQFKKWMNANKNYAAHISKRSLGLELNSDFLEGRDFTIGVTDKIERKAKEGYNEFLINNMLVTTDTEQRKDTGLIFGNPTLDLNITDSKGQLRVSTKAAETGETEAIKAKQPVPDSEQSKTEPQKQKEKKKPAAKKKPVVVKVLMRVENIKKIEEGKKTTTVRSESQADGIGLKPGESALVYWKKDQPHTITLRGQLTIEEAGGKEAMLKSEGVEKVEDLTYKQTQNWMNGKGKLFVYDIVPYTEEKAVEEKPPVTKNPLDDIDSQHKLGMEVPVGEEEPAVKIDIEKELAWLAERVNMEEGRDIRVVDHLLTIASTGRRAYALYGHDATLLYEGAAEGALYHEAFHRVSLGYLTKTERDSLYRTARQVYKMEEATDKEVEERLAEEFREFVLLKEKEDKPAQPKSIRNVFQRLYDWIKNVFAGPSRLRKNDVDRMFQQIYAGKYSNAKVLEENINNIKPGEYAMAVGRHSFETITSSKHRKDVVKMLADKTLKLNNLEDLNSLRDMDRIKAEPFFEWLKNTIDGLSTYKQETPEKQARADQLRLVFKEVDNNKAIFWDMINDYFSTIGITARNANLSEADIEALESNEDIVGAIDVDKRSSYEVSSKDNAMTSVKFTVSRLHESSEVDPVTGIQPFVEFNDVWSALLLNLHAFDNMEDIIEELRALGKQESDKPWYTELADALDTGDSSSENVRNQFLSTFSLWKHEFVTFHVFQNAHGEWIFNSVGNSQNELSRNSVLKWNEEFYLDERITSTSKEGEKVLNADFFIELEEAYQDLLDRVTDDVEAQNIEESYVNKHINDLVEMFNKLHIGIDFDTIQTAINEFYGDDTDLDSLHTMLVDDLKMVFGRESALYQEAVLRDKEELVEDEDIFRVQSAFISNPVLHMSDKSIGKAYAMAHPELQENVIIGAEGNKYFTYAQPNMATDIVKKLKRDDDFLETRRKLMYNTRSRVLKLLAENEDIRTAFYLRTYSALQVQNDNGRNYKQVSPLEEYLAKFHAIDSEKEYIPMPVMANRKQNYFMAGIPTLKDVVKDIKFNKNSLELVWSDETLNLFYDYFLDEKERVYAAHELRDEYNSPETSKARKKQIKETFVKNYHYADDMDLTKGGAYSFIHFKAFNAYKDPKKIEDVKEEEIKTVISGILNKLFKQEYEEAAKLGAIERVGTDLKFDALHSIKGKNAVVKADEELTDEQAETTGVATVLGGFMVNSMMGIIESEKVFFADPAFFAKDTAEDVDVADDMYKRWFGVGSTGARFAVDTESSPDSHFNTITLQTQKFKTAYYTAIYDRHVELYMEAGVSEADAKKRASTVLDGLKRVDPTDGQMIVSPEMYRNMSIRLGLWPKSKQDAYELMVSGKKLTAKEEIAATGIIMQPLKTVYIGKHEQNGLDVVIYDKMSMATIFRRQVQGGPLEELLDRFEGVGNYEGLRQVHAAKYDTATKIGGIPGIKLFTNATKRDKVSDLSKAVVQKQLFDNLKHQVVTDPHDNIKQTVGSQAYKVLSSNIHKDKKYGEYETGEELLEALTSSREALSNLGRERVKAKLGMKDGRIDNKKFIAMLSNDAKQAKKSYDFIQALHVDENNEPYLELDAFTDRKWVYSRIMSLIGKETVDLEMPGNQLIQVSDYGFSYDRDLAYSHPDEQGNITELEVRVSTVLFKHVIPNYNDLKHEERVKFLKEELKLIGYRVPVQGQNSTVRLKIVDFLREQSGDVIHLPLEFTALTGSDFDIDKLYVISYNYDKRARNRGRIERVHYIDGTSEISTSNRYEQKVIELGNIYRNNPEVIGQELFEELNSIEREKKELNTNRSALYNELRAAEEQEREIFAQLKKGAQQDLVDEHVEIWHRISDLKKEIGIEQNNFNEASQDKIDLLQQALVRAGILPTRSDFENFTIEAQNTREANENRILDIFHTVLGDAKHFLQTSTPLGALTGNLKDKAKRYTEALEGTRGLNSLETTTPHFQSRIRETFMGADQGIGAFALSNAHHGLTQHANFGMLSENQFGFEEEGEDTMWFNKINGQDDRPIMDWLSALIDSHVDAVKDPYIIKLNVNNATFDVVNLMIRAGAGEVTFDFISQPILRHFAQEFSNATGKILKKEVSTGDVKNAASFAYQKVKEAWAEDRLGLDTAAEFETEITLKALLKEETLQADIGRERGHRKLKKAEQQAYYVRQLAILEEFTNLSKDAKDLTRVVMASRIDTKKYGNTPILIRHFLNGLYNLEASDKFVNLDKLVRSDGVRVEGGTMLSTLLKNSALFGLEIMSDKSIYGSRGFSAIFGKILESIPSGNYANKLALNDVTEEIFAMLASEFFVDKEEGLDVTKESLNAILTDPAKSVFAQIQAVKTQSHKHYESLKDNKFLEMMIIDFNKTFEFPWYIRTPFHTLDDRWETDDYIDDYLALAQHESPEVRDLAKILYIYSYYTTGWRHRRHSFHTYTPTAMSKEIEVSEGKHVSYNEFIKKLRRRLTDASYTVSNINAIKRHIFRNNWFNENFVPKVHESRTEIIERNGKRVGLSVDFQLNRANYLGRNKDDHHIFAPYIKVADEEGLWLLEYAGYDRMSIQPNGDIKVKYRIVPRKGFSDMGVGLREYGFSSDQSILPKNTPYYIQEKEFTKMMEEDANVQSVPFKSQDVTDKTRYEDAFYKDFTRMDSEVEVERDEHPISDNGVSISTPEMPVKIFTDGSSTQKTNTLGFGAYFTWNGKEYKMSGTNLDINNILKDFKDITPHSPTMELIGMLEALRKFSDTAEHIYILTDNENNVNYEGIWERAVVNENTNDYIGQTGKRKKATKPNATGKAPWMEYIVPEIVKIIEKIEANGGSVRFQWIPGHITSDKAAQYPHAFAAEDGGLDNKLVEQYKLGNNKSDELAGSTTRESNFKSFGAPKIKAPVELEEDAMDNYQDRSRNDNPLC